MSHPLSDDAVGAPKFPHITLHRAIRIIRKHQPSIRRAPGNAQLSRAGGGLRDKHRTLDLCQIRIGCCTRRSEKEEIEIAELFSRKIDSSLRAKQVVLKKLDASGTIFETLSVAPGAERLRKVEG